MQIDTSKNCACIPSCWPHLALQQCSNLTVWVRPGQLCCTESTGFVRTAEVVWKKRNKTHEHVDTEINMVDHVETEINMVEHVVET